MFDRIMLARIGLRYKHQAEDLRKDLGSGARRSNVSNAEKLNFSASEDGRCHGYIMPASQHDCPPHPAQPHDWLVVFVAIANGIGVPVGWYENGRFATCYQHRPEPKLHAYLYIVSTDAQSAYLIPADNRLSFPAVPMDHFIQSYLYARSPAHHGKWRERYAELAEQIVRRKAECLRVG